jgi:AcrR family transcriptional regulator
MVDQRAHIPPTRHAATDSDATGARAARKARTREAILEAAGRAFAARGFDGASLREIAAAAGVAQPLLVYHFGSKEGVWRAAVDRLFGRVAQATEAALAEADPEAGEARLRALLRSFIGVVARDTAWLQILLREAAEPGPRLDWLVDHHSRATFHAGVGFLEEARASGWLPPLPTDHLLYVLVGALGFVIAIAPEVRRVTGRDVGSEAFLDRHVETVFQLMTAGRSAASH